MRILHLREHNMRKSYTHVSTIRANLTLTRAQYVKMLREGVILT